MTRVRQLTLDLEVGTEPISGRLAGGDGEAVPFAGWLELAAALERAVRADADEPGAGEPA